MESKFQLLPLPSYHTAPAHPHATDAAVYTALFNGKDLDFPLNVNTFNERVEKKTPGFSILKTDLYTRQDQSLTLMEVSSPLGLDFVV